MLVFVLKRADSGRVGFGYGNGTASTTWWSAGRGMMAPMPINLHRSAEITVRLPRDQTMALFTAEGERRWAEGWDPRYPALHDVTVPERSSAPRTAPTKRHGSWLTTARSAFATRA